MHTRPAGLGLPLQLVDEIIKLLLSLIPSLKALLLELRAVLLEELFVCWRKVIGQSWSANAGYSAAVWQSASCFDSVSQGLSSWEDSRNRHLGPKTPISWFGWHVCKFVRRRLRINGVLRSLFAGQFQALASSSCDTPMLELWADTGGRIRPTAILPVR